MYISWSVLNSVIKFFLIIVILSPEPSFSKKKIFIGGKYYNCKSPKNSFERTRGVKSRTCILSKQDKKEINLFIKNKPKKKR